MSGRQSALLASVSWLWVGVPFLYGVYQLLAKVPALFGS
jgi:hypothetical protein